MVNNGSSWDELRIHVISLGFAWAEYAFVNKTDVPMPSEFQWVLHISEPQGKERRTAWPENLGDARTRRKPEGLYSLRNQDHNHDSEGTPSSPFGVRIRDKMD